MASCCNYSGPCPYCDAPDEPEFNCCACEDQGLMMGQDGFVIPCTECSSPVELEDIEDFRGGERYLPPPAGEGFSSTLNKMYHGRRPGDPWSKADYGIKEDDPDNPDHDDFQIGP